VRLHLVAVGKRMPAWVREGYTEFIKRLPAAWAPKLSEIAPADRHGDPPAAQCMAQEAEKIRRALPVAARLFVLDEAGTPWTSRQLAAQLDGWMLDGRDVALVIGGADGLDPELKREAEAAWSLSPLTLPHALVRVIVAEQIYRAWTILNKHPYHRA
jgi:23S rRNA (pseudouridine1915-N3)-methyltransferase